MQLPQTYVNSSFLVPALWTTAVPHHSSSLYVKLAC